MKFVNPMKDTPEGKLLAIVRDIEKSLGIEKNSDKVHCDKAIDNMGCKDDDCPTCGKKVRKEEEVQNKDKADLDDDGELSSYERKRGKAIEAAMSGKKKVKKSDATSDFLQKYFQERSVDDVKPMYVEISGETEIPAHGPHYNQVLPYTEDGPKKSITSETYPMPSVYKTGYDVNGSSLHMKLNDGGTGGSMYRDKVEEALATIKKEATTGQLGLVQEIAGQIEQIYSRL
tara:strand:+ start:8994 stop:9683 length:690 start_codon:yes stop_codon:yes gene_type:complete